MPTKEEVITQAMKLPEADRLELAERIFQSMEGPADPDAERAWSAEIERRLKKIDAGQATLIPWEQARGQIMDETDESSAG